jgi:hypothetical protein
MKFGQLVWINSEATGTTPLCISAACRKVLSQEKKSMCILAMGLFGEQRRMEWNFKKNFNQS